MSKTTGNVVDPLEIIETTGADALRFALIHGATPGLDQRFASAKLDNARNFANKLWNATRFVLGARPSTIPASAPRVAVDPARLGPSERWMQSRAAAAVESVDRGMAAFQFAEVARVLYDAIWSEFCDWGLELAKVRLADASLTDAEREATWWTLVESLDVYLRLLHPVMPFVTEELWGALPHAPGDPELLIVAAWPAAGVGDATVDAEVAAIGELVRAIRNARAEAGIQAVAWLPVDVAVPAGLSGTFDALAPAIERLARARPLIRHATRAALEAGAPGGLAVIAGELEARITTATDASLSERDRTRLEKELAEAEGFLAAARARLANETFVSRAPEAVVAGARARESELADQVARLRDRLQP
jgi:valyl-tRNA synthetase